MVTVPHVSTSSKGCASVHMDLAGLACGRRASTNMGYSAKTGETGAGVKEGKLGLPLVNWFYLFP